MQNSTRSDLAGEQGLIIVTGLALVTVLVGSLAAFAMRDPVRQRRLLFFRSLVSGELVGEQRFVPARDNVEDDIALLVDELILGPSSLNSGRILPRGTEVQSILLRGKKVFLNFSNDFLLPEADNRLDVASRMRVVRDVILFNFRRVAEVRVFISGQIPSVAVEGGE